MTEQELLDWCQKTVEQAAGEDLDAGAATALRSHYRWTAEAFSQGEKLWDRMKPYIKAQLTLLGKVAFIASGGEGINADHIDAGALAAAAGCPICLTEG